MIHNAYQTMTLFACSLATTLALAQAPSQKLADQALSNENWSVAVDQYTGLLERQDDNANNWFALASAQHQLGQHLAAIDAYSKAIQHNYPQLPRIYYHLARALIVTEQSQRALTELEKIAEAGGMNYRIVQNTAEFEALANEARFRAVIEALKPCNDKNYRAFDFWLGEWDVRAANASSTAAINAISSTHDGCAILEQYQAGDFTGMSINFYDAARKTWHQTWIANNGSPLYLEGGPQGTGTMILSDKGLPGATEDTINRITWTLLDDGRVRQHWQNSNDEKIWATVFDGYYSKRESTSALQKPRPAR